MTLLVNWMYVHGYKYALPSVSSPIMTSRYSVPSSSAIGAEYRIETVSLGSPLQDF